MIKNIITQKSIPIGILISSLILFAGAYFWNDDSLTVFSLAIFCISIFIMFMNQIAVRSWFVYFLAWAFVSALIITTSSDGGWLMSERDFFTFIFIVFIAIFTITYFIYKKYINKVKNKNFKKTKKRPKPVKQYALMEKENNFWVEMAGNILVFVIILCIGVILMVAYMTNVTEYMWESTTTDMAFELYFAVQYGALAICMLILLEGLKRRSAVKLKKIIQSSIVFLFFSVLLLVRIPSKSDIYYYHSDYNILTEIMIFLVLYLSYIGLTFFIQSIFSFSISDSIFKKWFRFAMVWFCITIVMTIAVPNRYYYDTSDSYIMMKQTVSLQMSVLFIIISLIMFIWMTIKEKKNK